MGEKSGQGQNKSKQKVNGQNEKDVHRSVKFLNKSSGGSDFNSQSLKCIYTNADSFLNKFDEFKQRYVSESKKPDIIAITEVLPKNMRYTVNKAELDIEGYELFPGKFLIVAKCGIIIYAKKS
jgi:hypothetical protein